MSEQPEQAVIEGLELEYVRPEVQVAEAPEDDLENIQQFIGEEVEDPFPDTWPEGGAT